MNLQKFTCLLAGGALLLLGNLSHAQYTSTPNSAGGVDISGSGDALGPLNQSSTPPLSTHGDDNIHIVEFADVGGGGSLITLQTSGNTVTLDGALSATGGTGTGINITAGSYDKILLNPEGTISGFEFGISMGGGYSMVINNGWVDSTSESGIFISSSGNQIQNNAYALVSGYLDGLLINQGDSNSVTNSGSATISSSHGTGVEIDTSLNLVTNSGTIQGAFDGIALVNYGDVDSLPNITTGTNTIINSGLINGSSAYGIFVEDSDENVIQNKLGGMISGSSGIIFNGGEGNKVTNAGNISGANMDGIDENQALSTNIANQISGAIHGDSDGINIRGGLDSTIKNDGQISGSTGDGIFLNNPFDHITNTTLAMITGGSDGIHVSNGANESIINSGGIKGKTGYGIDLNSQSSTIENDFGGIISGGTAGIFIAGGSNMVTNSGSISGMDGIDENNASLATINNKVTGSIKGLFNGINITGGGDSAVTNDGQINGTTGAGIALDNSGDQIKNSLTGSIKGLTSGIYVNGGAGNTITNDGQINGTATAGIYVNNASANTIQNNVTGQINGTTNGILISNGSGNIINNEGIISGGGGGVNITGNNNVLNLNGHGFVLGKITMSGVGNVVNFNLTGLSPTKILSLGNALLAQGVNSGLPSPVVVFALNGVTYDIDPAIVMFHASSYQLQGLTRNQQAVGASLDSINSIPSPQLLSLFNTIDHSGNVPGMLEQLSPQKFEVYGELAKANADFTVQMIDSRLNNLRTGSESIDTSGIGGTTVAGLAKEDGKTSKEIQPTAPTPDRWGFFATGDGLFYRGDRNDASHVDAKSNTAGTLVGVDGKAGEKGVLGAFFAYNNSAVVLDTSSNSHATVQNYSGGLYGAWHDGGLYANGLAAYTRNDYKSERNLFLGGPISSNGSTTGNEATANIDGGYDWDLNNRFSVGPLAGLQYVHLDIGGFTESGAGPASLAVGSQDMDSLQSRLGLHANYHIATSPTSSFALDLHAAWQHEYLDDSRGIGASFTTAGLAPFSVQTSSPLRDAGVVGTGVNFTFKNRLTLFTQYELEFWRSSYFEQTISGGARISF